MLGHYDIHIYVIERDIYARRALVSYLSWDRTTRVIGHSSNVDQMFDDLYKEDGLVRLDVVVIDASIAQSPHMLAAFISRIREHLSDVILICLAHDANPTMAIAAKHAGADAYLVREQVGIGIAAAVRFAMEQKFTTTPDLLPLCGDEGNCLPNVSSLPNRRRYPRLTERIEQALWLCVVEGLPAELAADEMGVSVSTVRSYIKEGYRILEASDDTVYPVEMSPAERAFLRYSALEHDDTLQNLSHRPAA